MATYGLRNLLLWASVIFVISVCRLKRGVLGSPCESLELMEIEEPDDQRPPHSLDTEGAAQTKGPCKMALTTSLIGQLHETLFYRSGCKNPSTRGCLLSVQVEGTEEVSDSPVLVVPTGIGKAKRH